MKVERRKEKKRKGKQSNANTAMKVFSA